jgi:DedD protein
VVTVGADSGAVAATAPRSGDVDLTAETKALTPESPQGGAAAAAVAQAPTPEAAPEPAAERPAAKTTTKPAAKPAEPVPALMPSGDGGWLVQVGSFGEAANADRAAEKLRLKGWDARVKVGNTSDGTMIHRVQIGYFASRQVAESFIAQNRKDLAGAIAVHR